MRSIRAFALAGGIAVLLAACSSGGGGGDTTPTGLPSGVPTGVPSGVPTNIPTGGGGVLSAGTAHVEFSGGASATLDLDLSPGSAYAPGVAIGLAFQDAAHNTLAIAGTAFTGTVKTSSTVSLSFVVTNPVLVGASTAGECSITLAEASPSHVKGTADCTNVPSGTGTENLTVSFEATG
jgi:hypothetical protein